MSRSEAQPISGSSGPRGKYADLTKDQLIALLRQRDETRLGLVWERDPDVVGADGTVNEDFVAWDFDESLSVGDGPYQNLLVEGENYDALRALRMTHAGRIKCIEIDPPYNTGNNDFIYNDVFLNKEHRYRHSVWLEFMHKRLLIARDLLTDDGVIFVHIGEEEVHRLGCLLDQVFPGQKVGTFVWRTRSGAGIAKDYFASVDHEYVLCYANKGFSFSGVAKSFSGFGNPDNDPRGDWCNYNLTKGQSYKERPRSYFPIQNPDSGVWYPCNPDRVWAFSSEKMIKPGQKLQAKSMEQVILEDKVLWPRNEQTVFFKSLDDLMTAIETGKAPRHLRTGLPDLEFWVGKEIGLGMPRYKQHKSELRRSENPVSTWIFETSTKQGILESSKQEGVDVFSCGFTSEGSALLVQVLGNKDFPYPKPLSLIYGLLKQATGPDDIVLDFFGGSGTTGHAVLALNAEDGGNRRFIVVSSTEATSKDPKKNICRDISQTRLSKAVNGYDYRVKGKVNHVDGLGGNFAYLRPRRLPPGKVIRKLAHIQVWTALQLMHLEVVAPQAVSGPVWIAGGDEAVLIYLPKADAATLTALKKQKLRRAVVYSWQPELVSQHVGKAISVRPIPQFLMERFGLKP